MPLISAKNNLSNVRQSVDQLLSSATDQTLKRLIRLVGKISYRSDLFEREVERLIPSAER